jgi:hypothetical protein
MKPCRQALKQLLLTNSFYSMNIFIGNELKCVCGGGGAVCAHVSYKRAGKNVKLLYTAFSPFGRNKYGHSDSPNIVIAQKHSSEKCNDKQTLMSERQLETQFYIAYV